MLSIDHEKNNITITIIKLFCLVKDPFEIKTVL